MFILIGVREIDTAAGHHPHLIGAPGGPSKGLRKPFLFSSVDIEVHHIYIL
jgi:hypothetical protein